MAELRVKMGDVRQDVVKVPSQIDEDEWAEISRYHQAKNILKEEEERLKFIKQRQIIKRSLDSQIRKRVKTLEAETVKD